MKTNQFADVVVFSAHIHALYKIINYFGDGLTKMNAFGTEICLQISPCMGLYRCVHKQTTGT